MPPNCGLVLSATDMLLKLRVLLPGVPNLEHNNTDANNAAFNETGALNLLTIAMTKISRNKNKPTTI